MTRPDGPVRAAGGVLWRPGPDGVEVCLVHRPRYDDWSLPKGKLHRGEHPLAAAVREVAEETGVLAVPQVRLPSAGYLLPNGDAKSVDYWFMRAADDPGFTPNDEVDEVRWAPIGEAAGLLSFDHDATVVRRAAGLPPVGSVVLLLRHGQAGERAEWTGPDAVRPLDERGRRQARELVDLLAVFRPDRLVSASPVRCRETLEPLASRLGAPVEVDGSFDESAPTRSAVGTLRALAGSAGVSIVSGQGRLIPRTLGALLGEPADGYATRKGDGWLLAFSGPDLAGIDRFVGSNP